MRLGFHYHVPAYRDAFGHLRTAGPQGRFLDSLAAQCDELVCFLHSPKAGELPRMDHELRARNIHWVDIGLHSSTPRRLIRSPQVMRRVWSWRSRLDCMLLRGPSPLLPLVARATARLPVALLLVGDQLAGIDELPQPAWRRKLIRMALRWNHQSQLAVARRVLTLVNSRKLYEQLRPLVRLLYQVRTSTLTSRDFYHRSDSCGDRPIRLLYTGRMERAKGVLVLVEALAQLVERGEDVVLDLVGWAVQHDPVLEDAFNLASQRGVRSRIIFRGFCPLGSELFDFYRTADIYILASTSDFEGFPRTLWEAMAHSTPVVATTVGSIPMILRDRDSARLVQPRHPGALAGAVSEVIHSSALRRKMIRAGRRLAAANAGESAARDLMTKLRDWVSQCRQVESA